MMKLSSDQLGALCLAATSSLDDVMTAIDRGALGFCLIVEAGTQRLVGVVTDGDVRRGLLRGLLITATVDRVMGSPAVTAPVGATAESLTALFSDKILFIPLLDELGRVADVALLDRRVRLPVAAPTLGNVELNNVIECIQTNWISSGGEFVGQFERKFAEFCGVRHAAAVSNGTAALHVALVALGVAQGDEVIVPSLTFIATANAVTYTGARPVPTDSDPETWNLAPEAVERAITDATKAIIAVHLYGHPAELDRLRSIADRAGLFLIEDAAQAHGATFQDRPVGSWGDVATFSFFANKIITTGEGGMVVSDDATLMSRVRVLRDHGKDQGDGYRHSVVGFNYRLTNLQAASGSASWIV